MSPYILSMNEIKISIAFDANIISHAESRESDTLKIKIMKSSSTELLQSVNKLGQFLFGFQAFSMPCSPLTIAPLGSKARWCYLLLATA